MKKLGIDPDAHTYTVVLNGLAGNPRYYPAALGQALTIYYSLSSPTSNIRPSIIHTNAALKVCGRFKDLEALWTVAEKIPEYGPRAADSKTYTTMLNAIRTCAEGGKDKALVDAMQIWDGVMSRWQQNKLYIDEELGCAMGRCYLMSSRPEDWDEVLSLAQQIFGVPRLVPRLGTKARRLLPIANPSRQDKLRRATNDKFENKGEESIEDEDKGEVEADDIDTMGQAETEKHHTTSSTDLQNETNIEEGDTPSNDQVAAHLEASSLEPVETDNTDIEYDMLKPALQRNAVVGRNTLSLIMETCIALHAYDAGKNYWELFTNSLGVIPDLDNHIWYLRFLGQTRASTACVEHIEKMAEQGLQVPPNAFFISMCACRRNGTEHRRAHDKYTGFKDGTRLLDLMVKQNVEYNAKILIHYIRTALDTDDSVIYKRAWDRIGPYFVSLRTLISGEGKTDVEKERALELCKMMVSLADSMLHRQSTEWAPGEMLKMQQHRSKLNAYITRTFNKDGLETGDPKLMKQIKGARERQIQGKDWNHMIKSERFEPDPEFDDHEPITSDVKYTVQEKPKARTVLFDSDSRQDRIKPQHVRSPPDEARQTRPRYSDSGAGRDRSRPQNAGSDNSRDQPRPRSSGYDSSRDQPRSRSSGFHIDQDKPSPRYSERDRDASRDRPRSQSSEYYGSRDKPSTRYSERDVGRDRPRSQHSGLQGGRDQPRIHSLGRAPPAEAQRGGRPKIRGWITNPGKEMNHRQSDRM